MLAFPCKSSISNVGKGSMAILLLDLVIVNLAIVSFLWRTWPRVQSRLLNTTCKTGLDFVNIVLW